MSRGAYATKSRELEAASVYKTIWWTLDATLDPLYVAEINLLPRGFDVRVGMLYAQLPVPDQIAATAWHGAC